MKIITKDDLQSMENPNDGWYMIEPHGEHPTMLDDGREILQVIDDEAVKAIVESFGNEQLVDRDHLSRSMDHDTGALSWCKELAALDLGEGYLHIAGRQEFTSEGRPLIVGKVFKKWSTEYAPYDLVHLGGNRYRPMKLSGLALTNRENNKGQIPITNRESSQQTQQEKTMELKAKIIELLGLAPEATDEQIIADLTQLTQSVGEAQEKEAEAVLTSEGLTDLPEDVQQDLIEELITNRDRGMRMINLIKNRQGTTTTGTGKPKYAKQNSRPDRNPLNKNAMTGEQDYILNRVTEIRKDSKSPMTYWEAHAKAKAEARRMRK